MAAIVFLSERCRRLPEDRQSAIDDDVVPERDSPARQQIKEIRPGPGIDPDEEPAATLDITLECLELAIEAQEEFAKSGRPR